MKLGILGGSFNPVHHGHLFLADTALTVLKLDRVVMIPAYRSPFKPGAEGMESSANDRIAMLASAVIGDCRLAIDDCEIKREGISYTVNTLEDIIARYLPEGKPFLIIGDDLADDFPKWHDCERILQLAEIVIARRLNSAPVKYPFPHKFIDNEVMNISSETIRQKITERSGWKSLVPSGVRAIIEDKHLYGYSPSSPSASPKASLGASLGASPGDAYFNLATREWSVSKNCTQAAIINIETTARENLSTARFLHSRNTALIAQELCRRFDLDPAAGYLAGIAHDLCKQLDAKDIMKLAKSDHKVVTDLEKGKPSLLHGRAAAVLLKERFSIHNKDILEAVAFHTMGSENMGPLAKVIYIADKVEVSRNIDPALRKMCREESLDRILFTVVKKTVSKLQSRELDLSEDTLRLLDRMKERNI